MPVASTFSSVRCQVGDLKVESLGGSERKAVHGGLSREKGR